MPPLNGTKTHPLKPASIAMLKRMAESGPVDAYKINPGIRDRLSREGLAEECHFRGYEHGTYYRITNAGRKALADLS